MRLVPLGKIAEIDRDGIAPEQILSGTPYLGLEHIESGGRILSREPVNAGELASTKFRFGADHVLYGKLRPYLAKIAMPDFEGICSTDIVPIRPGSDLDKRYLAYFLRQPSMVAFANSRATGANLPRLIGRGTRLRRGIFLQPDGSRTDKEYFYVFDYLGNLDFFNAQIEGAEAKAAKPLAERLFAVRVDLMGLLQPSAEGGNLVKAPPQGFRGEQGPSLYEGVKEHLVREVAGMPIDNFIVRAKRRHVEKFQKQEAWKHLGEEDRHELVEHVAGLPTSETDPDIDAKRFDMLCLNIQLGMLRKANFEPLRKAFVRQVHALEAKEAVPDVAREMVLIQACQTSEWWQDATPEMVETARRRLRGLMSLIEPGNQVIVSTDLIDTMGTSREVELIDLGGASSLAQFRKKARAYVDAHADHVTLARLRQGKPLTQSDLDELQRLFADADVIGAEDFAQVTKTLPDLPAFIRSLIGLDRNAAKQAFNEVLPNATLSARQIRFVETIIDQLTANGTMDPAALYEPPYTNEAPNGVSDLFEPQQVEQIIETVSAFTPRLASTQG